MKKVLVTYIDINYQLYFFLLYYIDKLKDSFKVYCYENVQKILRMFGKWGFRIIPCYLYFHIVVLSKRTNAAKFLFKLFVSNGHFFATFYVACSSEKDNNSVFHFTKLLSLYLHTKFFL